MELSSGKRKEAMEAYKKACDKPYFANAPSQNFLPGEPHISCLKMGQMLLEDGKKSEGLGYIQFACNDPWNLESETACKALKP